MTNISDSLKTISQLNRDALNCNVFSVYDYDCLSMQELLCTFFTKINECVDVSNKTVVLVDWLVNQGLSQEVAKKLNQWLVDGTLANIINETVFNDLKSKITLVENEVGKLNNVVSYVSVKNYGAKGDGVTDDSQPFVDCFNYCTENNKTMFIPNGTYIVNVLLKKSNHPTHDPNSNKPIRIVGESYLGVKINTTNQTRPIIDASRTKNVYMENIFSDNSWFHVLQYGDEFREFSRKRDIFIKNVGSLSTEGSYPSWNLLINTPAPNTYNNTHMRDSIYNRYPMEIVNNSGFNAMMINNLSNTNSDGTPGYPSDNSAIGIIDEVTNSTGVILIDCNTRSNYQVKNGKAESKSGVREDVVYEIDQLGHVSIGCSTQNGDTVAPGTHTVKLRSKYPSVALYDQHRGNRKTVIGSSDDTSYIDVYNETGEIVGGVVWDYKKKIMTPKNCDLAMGSRLDIDDNTWTDFAEAGWRNIIKFNVSSAKTFNGLNGGSEGQFLTLVSTNSNVTIKHDAGWSQGIRLKNATNLTLQPNMCILLQKLHDGWYQING